MTAFAEEVDAYTALKAAVEAAPTNGTQTTVTLTGDITDLTTDQILEIKAGQNIVLNMDGHSNLGLFSIIFVIPFASLKAQTSYEKMLYLSTI